MRYDPRDERQDLREPHDRREQGREPPRLPVRELEALHDARGPALERERELAPAQQRILVDLAAFRVAQRDDLIGAAGRRNGRADMDDLVRRGLVTSSPLGPEKQRYFALTKEGARRVRCARPTRRQAIHAGFAKRHVNNRGLAHDAAVYRACRAETARQEPGTRLVRVSLDVDVRAEFQRDVAREERARARALEARELEPIAARYHLPLSQEGRVHYPDAQLEFERDDGTRAVVGVEVTTDDYRARSMAAKAQAGFSLYHMSSSAGRAIPTRADTAGVPVHIEEYGLWAL